MAPTKLNDEVQKRITDGIRAGLTHNLAAQAGGVTLRTFNLWRADNPDFAEAVDAAEADIALRMVAVMVEAAEKLKDWRAAESFLARRFRAEYGRQELSVSLTSVAAEDTLAAIPINNRAALLAMALERLSSIEQMQIGAGSAEPE